MKRGMDVCSDQAFIRPAMGIMAGETLTGLGREPLMSRHTLRLLMTAQTKLIAVIVEQLVVIGIMRLMTGHTIAGRKGLMLYRILFFGQGLMAAQTALGNGPTQ